MLLQSLRAIQKVPRFSFFTYPPPLCKIRPGLKLMQCIHLLCLIRPDVSCKQWCEKVNSTLEMWATCTVSHILKPHEDCTTLQCSGLAGRRLFGISALAPVILHANWWGMATAILGLPQNGHNVQSARDFPCNLSPKLPCLITAVLAGLGTLVCLCQCRPTPASATMVQMQTPCQTMLF